MIYTFLGGSSYMTIDFLKVESVEELKKYGSLSQVREKFRTLVGNEDFELKTNTWDDMLESILKVQHLLKNLEILQQNKDDNEELYFKGKAEKYLFYLLELEGEERLKKLGVNKMHYANKERANKWKNNIAKIIHPDNCHHVKAEEAMKVLDKLYEEMVKR